MSEIRTRVPWKHALLCHITGDTETWGSAVRKRSGDEEAIIRVDNKQLEIMWGNKTGWKKMCFPLADPSSIEKTKDLWKSLQVPQ